MTILFCSTVITTFLLILSPLSTYSVVSTKRSVGTIHNYEVEIRSKQNFKLKFNITAAGESEMSTFKYPPIEDSSEDIRLIHVEFLDADDSEGMVVKFSLHNITLDNIPPVYTLSYRWSGPPMRIECDSQPVWIAANFESLLRQMRRKKIGPLWADAILMN